MKEQRFDLASVLADVSKSDTVEQIEYLSIDDILPDENNFYQLSGIPALMENIEMIGLQQPIRVRPNPNAEGKYIIISGHRRHAACKLLAESNERFRLLPCIVERQEESDSLRQLRLIYANSATRTKTSAEIGEEAAQVEQLLYQLKEEGYEFPGRMRDHVAEACRVSASKLARIRVIRSNLVPQFMRLWEKNELSESTAYSLAQLTPVRQKTIYIAQTDDGKKKFPCTDGWVQNIAKEMDRMRSIGKRAPCEIRNMSECDHAVVRENRAAKLSQYARMNCSGCCCSCSWLTDCHYSCEYAGKEKLARKNARKDRAAAEKAEQRAKDEPKRELMRSTYQRVKALREEKNVSLDDFMQTTLGGTYYGPYRDKYEKLEKGDKIDLTMRMPGGIWPDDVQRLCATADLLGCSIDYLLGHDTQKKPEPAASPIGWQTGTPGESATVLCCLDIPRGGTLYQKMRWDGKAWLLRGMDIKSEMHVRCWMPEPEDT